MTRFKYALPLLALALGGCSESDRFTFIYDEDDKPGSIEK